MTEQPTNKADVVVGVIVEKKQILIVERQTIEVGEKQGLLHWVFPGGRVESGETEEEAVVREVAEETGRTVSVDRLIITKQHPEFPVVISYFLCTPVDASFGGVSLDEIREARWINIDELPNYFTSTINSDVAMLLKSLV